MDDYISRQTAIDAAIKMFNAWYGHSWLRTNEIRARFEQLPSADVQQVVRCKDCKFGRYDIGDRGMYCGRKNVRLDTYEDDFCSFGERKDGEQDG